MNSNRKAALEMIERLADDEPIFVLRAQDALAPQTVRFWAEELIACHGREVQKAQDALNVSCDMLAWQTNNKMKMPD